MAFEVTETTPAKTPEQRGLRSMVQVAIGSLTGLLLTVWQVPGVPEAVAHYAQQNFVSLLIGVLTLIGIPTAVTAYIQNKLETKA